MTEQTSKTRRAGAFGALASRWWDRDGGSACTTSTRPASDYRSAHRLAGKRVVDSCGGLLSEAWPGAAQRSPASICQPGYSGGTPASAGVGTCRSPICTCGKTWCKSARAASITCMELLEHAGSGVAHRGLCTTGQTRRQRHRIDTQPDATRIPDGHRRGRVPDPAGTARHASLRETDPAIRTRCLGTSCGTGTRSPDRWTLQPAGPELQPGR
jgi:hypothetical protein